MPRTYNLMVRKAGEKSGLVVIPDGYMLKADLKIGDQFIWQIVDEPDNTKALKLIKIRGIEDG